MLIRFALVLALLAAPATAASLCRDLKGLYTPCAPGQAPPKARKIGHEGRPGAATTPAVGTSAAEQQVAHQDQHQLVAHSKKLCRDTKGLYTPCPR
jgi:hypothetical protein